MPGTTLGLSWRWCKGVGEGSHLLLALRRHFRVLAGVSPELCDVYEERHFHKLKNNRKCGQCL